MADTTTVKVRQREYRAGGGSGGGFYVRVVEKAGRESLAENEISVPEETEVCDWRHELPEEVPAEE